MKNWMGELKNTDMNITKMAIPGTHDSGASSASVLPLTRAQTLSIKDQLNIGVRALDIRVGQTNILWEYKVFHGPVDQGITVASVFKDINDFLDMNVDEFVILMLKQETGYLDISTAINDLVEKHLGTKVFKRSDAWPTLAQAKGSVLVLSRLKYPDNDHFDTREWANNPERQTLEDVGIGDSCRIVIQDLYNKPAVDDKEQAVKELLMAANVQQGNVHLYLNFASYVSYANYSPYKVGETFNSEVLPTCDPGTGVICVDGVDEDITKLIVSWNSFSRDVPVVVNPNAIVKCVKCKDPRPTEETTKSTRWHYCKTCKFYWCNDCGYDLERWGYFSQTRKCNYCRTTETELV